MRGLFGGGRGPPCRRPLNEGRRMDDGREVSEDGLGTERWGRVVSGVGDWVLYLGMQAGGRLIPEASGSSILMIYY